MTNRRSRAVTFSAVLATIAVGLAGCLQDPNAGGGGEDGVEANADNNSPDGDGVVTISGSFGGAEAERFAESLAVIEQETGIDIQYTPDTNFVTNIRQRASAGEAPDIGLFPQPGGLLDLASDGLVQPIDTYLDFDQLDRTLVPGFLESSRLNGRVYGAPIRMAVKSLVWYPRAPFDSGGYSADPASVQELMATSDQIKSDGIAPWCMGWNDAANTGWVGTDWLEEYMLRMHGPDVYDDWVSHQIPFNDPLVVEALDAFGELALTDGNVRGGATGIENTSFAESFLPALENPPLCMMERQGNFLTSFLPDSTQANLDEEIGVFLFPPYEGGYAGQPILGGGDLAALFNGNDEDAITVMRFLTSDEFGVPWAQAGGWLSPHRTFDVNLYPTEAERSTGQFVAEADVFRFDGSDLMPSAIGSDAFWDAMVDWVGGADSQTVLTEVEEIWQDLPSEQDDGSDG
ncbi:MAG: ABC transporter substrate-binding protein [Beutenbergiaceae bacterium]